MYSVKMHENLGGNTLTSGRSNSLQVKSYHTLLKKQEGEHKRLHEKGSEL